MKILLLGKNGQVGTALKHRLSIIGEVIACDRTQIDLENLNDLRNALPHYKPDVIVNAAAYTAVDNAENDQVRANLVNAKAVAVLAQYAHAHQNLLVHYSTDYVYDGSKSAPYLETDKASPLNIYGQSKLAGENNIIKSQCESLIFRTSWVFGTNGNNFIKTILKLAHQRDELKVVNDQFGAPTSANLIADVTTKAIQAYLQQKMTQGIYHLTNSGSTNWHQYACHIVKQVIKAGQELRLSPQRIEAISSESYPFIAKRPKNSRLNTAKLSDALEIKLPSWEDDVDRFLEHLSKQEAAL